jgi:hypothetical protein
MLIFIEQKTVLLSTPKTGSTALEMALQPLADEVYSGESGVKHIPARRYKELIEPSMRIAGITNLETVAVIRHPIKWLGSWYRYRYRWAIHDTPESTRGVNFDTFVNGYLDEKQSSFAKLGSQAKFLTSKTQEPLVDHVFQYEQSPRLIRFLNRRLDISIKLDKENVSPKLKLALSPDVEARLRAEQPLDFGLWNDAHR